MAYSAQKNRSSVQEGFSIIELMVVIFIIGLLLAFIGTRVGGASEKAKLSTAKQQVRTLQEAIERFHDDTGEYPDALEDLARKPAGEAAANWEGPYLKTVPKDPWKKKYQYQKTDGAEHDYELYSNGPKGKERISAWELSE